MLVYIILINIVSFLIMVIDKRKAKMHKWRIAEKRIWVLAIIGGALGATVGMHLFRHKTKHKLFFIGLPFLMFLQIGLLIYWKISLS
ncbi:DUF1294 domain-containing protein [Gracilibacillus sp. S3-1-1]|uniref:DUF1294 domain-containing protein n=1 Tax=Gracilibacillus pellucidus TaxID=3095368 RepID=A0ACC6M6Q6_9BACI|nr:DUF1294 domain-containing protein [Gracilibacillus sp. S3-1-1]MDX8046659.1 DUF1294 domain-containing protein [Gracilibacillus sp. S3-1-1]